MPAFVPAKLAGVWRGVAVKRGRVLKPRGAPASPPASGGRARCPSGRDDRGKRGEDEGEVDAHSVCSGAVS